MAADTSTPQGWAATLDSLLNKGIDVAAQLATAKLNQPKTTVVQTTSANAGANTAGAGSKSTPTATASKLPAWVLPTVIGAGVLAVLGLLFGILRRRK